MKYKNSHLAIFYSSQCDDMIAVTSELFNNVGKTFIDCVTACILTSSTAKGDIKSDQTTITP